MSHQRGTIDTVLWFWVVVLVALIGAIAIVASGRGDTMAEVYDDRPDAVLTSGRPLTADDLREVRLNTGVRGYRMDEVDALLGRLEAELIEREDAERVRLVEPAGEIDRQPGADPLLQPGPGEERVAGGRQLRPDSEEQPTRHTERAVDWQVQGAPRREPESEPEQPQSEPQDETVVLEPGAAEAGLERPSEP